MFKKIFFISIVLASSLFSTDKDEYLVCLHGFMGSSWNMHFLNKNLKKDGWDTINWGYSSRNAFITKHGERLAEDLLVLSKKRPGKPIHFVAHSMGSLVLLSALNHPLCPDEAKIGKVVLITPALKGSYVARWINQFSLTRWVMKGFSGYELMTKSNFDNLGNYPDSLDKILVIAGSLGFNPLIDGENDGTLALHETALSIPHERVVIKRGHKTILFSKKAYRLITQFLKK